MAERDKYPTLSRLLTFPKSLAFPTVGIPKIADLCKVASRDSDLVYTFLTEPCARLEKRYEQQGKNKEKSKTKAQEKLWYRTSLAQIFIILRYFSNDLTYIMGQISKKILQNYHRNSQEHHAISVQSLFTYFNFYFCLVIFVQKQKQILTWTT